MANPWEMNWGWDDDTSPAQQPVAQPVKPRTHGQTAPWEMNWDWGRASAAAGAQNPDTIKPNVTIGNLNQADYLRQDEWQSPELLHEDAATQDFKRPEGELFHARSFVPGAMPYQAPTATEDPTWWDATAGAGAKGFGDLGLSAATVFGDDPRNVRQLPLNKLDNPMSLDNDSWSMLTKKAADRAIRMFPMALGMIAGTELGAGPTLAASSVLTGGAAGSALGAFAQSLGPRFKTALLKYPDDPERAWQEAGNATLIDGGFAALGGLAMGNNPFATEFRNAMFQMFVQQPAVGVGNMYFSELYTGDHTDQPWYDRYLENVAPGIVQTGAHEAGKMAGRIAARPGSELPGAPGGPTDFTGGDDHFMNDVPEAMPSERAAAGTRGKPATAFSHLDRYDPNYEPRNPRRSDGDNVTPLRHQVDDEPIDTTLRDINEQLPLKSREVFNNLKLTRAPMADWHSVLLNKGVKPEELKDLGLTKESERDPKKMWTRDEIDALMKRNTPVFKEHLYSAKKHDDKRYTLTQPKRFDDSWSWVDNRTNEAVGSFDTPEEAMRAMPEDAVAVFDHTGEEHEGPLSNVGYSKWDQYGGGELVSPGVKNYEERVVQQNKERPYLKGLNEYIRERFGEDKYNDIWQRMTWEERDAVNKEYERDVVGPWQQAVREHQASRWNIGDTPGDHFGIHNSIYHNRYGTMEFDDGVIAHHDDETQSDTIQKGRTNGFRDESPDVIRNRADVYRTQYAQKQAEWRGTLDNWAGLRDKLTGHNGAAPLRVYASDLKTLMELPPDTAERLGYTPFDVERARRDYDKVIRLQNEAAHMDVLAGNIADEASRIPIVPHVDSWGKLSMKRMIQVALSKGLRHISWTTGEQQAQRYGLEKKIKSISFRPADRSNPGGDKVTWAAMKHDGNYAIQDKTSDFKDLADHIGSELARKIFDRVKEWDTGAHQHTWLQLNTDDLKLGGEFHKKLYDKKKVEWARELGRPFGFKPELKSTSYEDTSVPIGFRPFKLGDATWNRVADALRSDLRQTNVSRPWGTTEVMLRTLQKMEEIEQRGANGGDGSSSDLMDYLNHEFVTNDREKLFNTLRKSAPSAVGRSYKMAIAHEPGSDARRQLLAAVMQLKDKLAAGQPTGLLRSWFNRNDLNNPGLIDELIHTAQSPNRNLATYFEGLRTSRLDSTDDANILMRAIEREQKDIFGSSTKPLFELKDVSNRDRQMWRMEITPKMGKQFRYQIAADEEKAAPGTLAVVHNISAQALRHAADVGGLPAPSIGIVKAAHGLQGYGEISLLGHASLIDPERGTKVYRNDAYSSRYPVVRMRVDPEKIGEIERVLGPEAKRLRLPPKLTSGEKAFKDGLYSLNKNKPLIAMFAREHGMLRPGEELGSEPRFNGRFDSLRQEMIKRKEFVPWLKEKFRDAIAGEEFTDKTTGETVAHTLANVLRYMTGKGDVRASTPGHGPGHALSSMTEPFLTRGEIKSEEGRLVHNDEYLATHRPRLEAQYESLMDVLQKYRPGDAASGKQKSKISPARDWAHKQIIEAARSGDPAAYVARHISNDQRLGEVMAAFVDSAKNTKTRYFEAKMDRTVRLPEFKAAVIPSNIAESDRQLLADNGIHEQVVYKYSEDPMENEYNRQRAIESLQHLLFQREAGGELSGRMDDLRKVSLTKEQAAKHAPVMKSIMEEIKRIAPGAKVAFVEQLMSRNADGSVTPIRGTSFGDMVVVALRNKNAEGTGRHEGGHVIVDGFKEMGIFKPHEWQALKDFAEEKLYGKHKDFLRHYEGMGDDVKLSEAIVQELGEGRPTKFKGYPPIIRKMLYRMDGILKAIRVGVHRVLGKKVRGEDVLDMLDAGHIGARVHRLKKLGENATRDYSLATDKGGKVHYQISDETKVDNIFESALDIALENTKLTRGHGAQWRAELIKQGVKPEELRDTGLDDLFTSHKDQPLTKDHIINRREDNRTELHVIIRDDGGHPLARAGTNPDEQAQLAQRTAAPDDPLAGVDMWDDMDELREYIEDNDLRDEIDARLEDYDDPDNPRERYEAREWDQPTYRVVERNGRGESLDWHGTHNDHYDAEWEIENSGYYKTKAFFHTAPRQVGGLLTRLMGKEPVWVVDIHQHATDRKNRPVDIWGDRIDPDLDNEKDHTGYELSDPENEEHDGQFHNHQPVDEVSASTPEEAIKKANEFIREESRVFEVEEEEPDGYRIWDHKHDDWHVDGEHFDTKRSAERSAERENEHWYEEWSEEADDQVRQDIEQDHDWWVERAVEHLQNEGSERDSDELADLVREHWYGTGRDRSRPRNRDYRSNDVKYGTYNLKGGTYKREYLLTIPTLSPKLQLAAPGSTALTVIPPGPNLPDARPRDLRVRQYRNVSVPTHFTEQAGRNIMMHFRAQDFMVEDGGKAIVLEEDQSDPHQAARQAAKAITQILGLKDATGYGVTEREAVKSNSANWYNQAQSLGENSRAIGRLMREYVINNKALEKAYADDLRPGDSDYWANYGEHANWDEVGHASEYLSNPADAPRYLLGAIEYLKERLKTIPAQGLVPNAKNALVEAMVIARAKARISRRVNKLHLDAARLRDANVQVDSLPHKDSWPMLGLKYILHEAIMNGYDYVGMPTGAQQVDRYPGALRTAIKKLVWKERRDGKFDLDIDMQSADRQHRQRHVLEGLTEHDIKNNLGAAGAEQIVKQRFGRNNDFVPTSQHVAEGEIGPNKLHINNQGMMNFYDKTVQKDSKAFLAKMGLSWGRIRVLQKDQTPFAVMGKSRHNDGEHWEWVEDFHTKEEAEAYAEHKRIEARDAAARGEEPYWKEVKVDINPDSFHEIHGIKITPEARQNYQTEITDKTGKVVKPANKMLRYQIADGETNYADRVARATTDTPEFKRFFEGSVVKTPSGQPLKLFRGQRRNPREDGFTLSSGRATPSFTPDPDVASVYSRQLDTREYGAGSNVVPTYLSIKNPLDLRALGEHPSLGEVVELLPYDWREPSALDQFKVGYADLAEALRDMDTTVFRTNAEHDIRAGDRDGLRVRSFDELADLIEQLGEDGDYEGIENALADVSVDAYSFADSPMFVDMLKQAGYDGVIHKDVFESGADHYEPGRDKLEEGSTGVPVHDTYRPFDQEQIKSTHNTGTWGTRDKRILYQAAGDTESPQFKKWFGISRSVDANGKPLPLFRGEHGEVNGDDIQTRLPSITLVEDPDIASMYAEEPNKREDVARAPRVGQYYARIERPIFEDKTDPFTELGPLARKLGREPLLKVIENRDALESAIMSTDNWHEKYSDYGSVREVLDKNPAAIDDLYIQANILLDDPGFVKLAKSKGYDGAIHLAWSAAKDAVEHRVFDKGQIKGVNNGGEWSTTDKRVMYQKGDGSDFIAKEVYGKGELAPADPKVNTPEFRAWWKKSHAVDAIGHPRTVYHGSLRDVEEFRPGNNGNYLGNRFYFSSNRQDASQNYANRMGTDFDARAWMRAAGDARAMTRDQLEQAAEEWKNKNSDHYGAVYPFYLSIQNPVYLGGPSETRIPKSTVHAMMGFLPDVLKGVDSDLAKSSTLRPVLNKWLGDLMNEIRHGSTMAASDFVRKLLTNGRVNHAVLQALPKFHADNPLPEVLRGLFEKMGFDGAIDPAVRGKFPGLFNGYQGDPIPGDVTHYIAFHPNQIKSVNNTGSFSERMNHILYQVGDKLDTKYEDAPQGGRFLDGLRDGFANGKVDKGEQAYISDQPQDLERVYKKDWLELRRGAPHLKQFAIMLHGKPIGRINGTVNGESMEVQWIGLLGGDDGLSDSSIRHLGAILREALPRGVNRLTGLRKRAEQKSDMPPIRPQEPAPKPAPRIITTRGREDPLLDYYRDLGVDLGD